MYDDITQYRNLSTEGGRVRELCWKNLTSEELSCTCLIEMAGGQPLCYRLMQKIELPLVFLLANLHMTTIPGFSSKTMS